MKLRSEPPLKAALPLTVLGSSADVRCIPISVADVAFAPSETTEPCQPEKTDPTPIVVISWGIVSSGRGGRVRVLAIRCTSGSIRSLSERQSCSHREYRK
jgi:hypothetical protein